MSVGTYSKFAVGENVNIEHLGESEVWLINTPGGCEDEEMFLVEDYGGISIGT